MSMPRPHLVALVVLVLAMPVAAIPPQPALPPAELALLPLQFDLPLYVDEAGDTMAGALRMAPGADIACDGCISSTDVSFDYACGVTLGGAACDVACMGCVEPGDVSFNYACGGSKGGAACDADQLDGLDSTVFPQFSSGGNLDVPGAFIGSAIVVRDPQAAVAWVARPNATWFGFSGKIQPFDPLDLDFAFEEIFRLEFKPAAIVLQDPLVASVVLKLTGGAAAAWTTSATELGFRLERRVEDFVVPIVDYDYSAQGNVVATLHGAATVEGDSVTRGDSTVKGNLLTMGNSVTLGMKNAAVPTSQGLRLVYAQEQPSPRFSDEGLAQLQGGVARVDLDPLFAETIEGPLLVHLTPEGPASLYVAEKGPAHFVVKSLDGTDVPFAWQASAARRGAADLRLEPMG